MDEIQKMRVKLKSSKSFPNELRQESNHLLRPEQIEEGDNSSSGVSSDQEVTITHSQVTFDYNAKPLIKEHTKKGSAISFGINSTICQTSSLPLATTPNQFNNNDGYLNKPHSLNNIKKNVQTIIVKEQVDENERRSDDDDSPSPPAKGFQRHNSLTRKQAATIAMNRAIQSRTAVSLVKLPPPIEADHELEGQSIVMHTSDKIGHSHKMVDSRQAATENLVLAPPPQFCDCTNTKSSGGNDNVTTRGVRIVGAVPKVNIKLPLVNDLCD